MLPDERIQAAPPSRPSSADPPAERPARRREPWITYAIGLAVFGVLMVVNFWPYRVEGHIVDQKVGCGFPYTHATALASTALVIPKVRIRATVSGGGPDSTDEEYARLLAADERDRRESLAWKFDPPKVVLNLGVALLMTLAAMLVWSALRSRSALVH